MITMLDEKFNLTEKMGYTMEADKQRTALNGLLRQEPCNANNRAFGVK